MKGREGRLSNILIMLMLIGTTGGAAPLLVAPSFLLVAEDFQVGTTLPVEICPGKVKIISGNSRKTFSVVKKNDTCSTLRLNSELDADSEIDGIRGQSFSLVLSGPRNSRATLDVQVIDVNDNPPQFINPPTMVTVAEDQPVGFAVAKFRTRDADTGVAGMARFSVESDIFSIDKQKCSRGQCSTTLRLQKLLDYESQRVHHLTITAQDGDPHTNATNTATHTMTVQVTDVQDTPPKWLTDFSRPVVIDSKFSVGQELVVLRAIDGDVNDANDILYSIEENEYLSVNDKSGSVKLKKRPGPNTQIRISVTAKEDAPNGMASTEVMTIKDEGQRVESNNQMTFDLCTSDLTEASVKEGATDFEQPLNIQFKENVPTDLSIVGANGVFAIKPPIGNGRTAQIIIEKPGEIDYEKEKRMEFFLSSSNGKCRVIVSVLDENDNSPVFTNDTFLFYVTENHKPTLLGEVTATDADSAAYLPIEYSIVGDFSEFFAISAEGQLRSLKPIDREQNDRFDLVIRATDKGGRWTDCPGKVVVRDINDNSPVFEQTNYELSIDEEKSVKHRITATDADLGENSHITYTLDEVPDGIPIDISSGILFIGKLDRDTMETDRVDVVLRATDGGNPRRSTTANLTIRVKDINDNYPVFSNSRYSLVLDANISPGGVIGAVEAEDGDATSPNNHITFHSNDTRFKVTEKGEVIYTGEGVLSKDSSTAFRVTGSDGGVPSRNSSTTVSINEHKAAMQSQLTTELTGDGVEKRTEIKWANARMAGYKYSIVRATADRFKDSEVRSWLEIDEDSGEIHTLKPLSAEDVKQIRLSISMTKGKRQVPVELVIKVVDSDSVPFFKKEVYRAIVPEDIAIGARVLQVKASGDSDNLYKYALVVLDGPKNVLSIDNSGWIFHLKGLDFEKSHKISGKVLAEDGEGNVAATNFSVQITDANDNRPVFANGSVFTVEIEESAPIGSVLELQYPLATDEDSGLNSQLRYSLIGDDGHFEIDQRSSKISLIQQLDFESQRVHSLTVRCVDNADKKPFHEVFAAVTIKVIDTNDNRPVIHNSDLLHLTVSEDATEGTAVTVLSVSDADEGGRQSVSLNANHTLFRVDDTNTLMVSKSLNGYAGERLCSSLVATDSGHAPLMTSLPYCVTVYPAADNQHNPLILSPKPNSIHYFDENVQYDELLRIKLLEEKDMKSVNYKFDKTFKKDWESFSLNSSGSLSSKAPFDFEKKNVHEVKVLACRSSNCSSVHIFVSVNDRNDNCPIFPKQDVSLSLMENDKSPLPRKVGRIPAALDADFHSDNTKVCYSTASPLFFFLDPTIPMLYTNTSFDREQHKQHQITIVAYDCVLSCRDPHKPMNGSITGVVEILDVNDNFPRFKEKNYHATVIQGQAAAGSHLTSLSATDLDEEKEGLRYKIKGVIRAGKHSYGVSDAPITVDEITGEVSANDVLKEPLYTFPVTVTDGAGHEDSTSVTISVVTYAQQAELLFDAPFEFVVRNEKHIVSLLSDTTRLNAVVDRCRQNSNFTLVLAHFIDEEGQFVEVERAVELLSSSNSTAKRELRNAYGLRDTVAPVHQARPPLFETVAIGAVAALLVLLLLIICIWCRQRNNYSNKLRNISVQAAAHQATLARPMQKPSGYYIDGIGPLVPAGNSRLMAPPPPLQSTEL